jgi:very-short-patch-repair endonuclease
VVTERTSKVRKARSHLRAYARDMRREPTDAEKKFWRLVRDRRLAGSKFKRQYPIGRYIADFVCLEAKLIVELDGGRHAEQQAYDAVRDAFLAAEGFHVLRFWNSDVLTNADGIAERLFHLLKGGGAPSPQPSPPETGEME